MSEHPHKRQRRSGGSSTRRFTLPRGKTLRWKVAVPIAAACAGLLAVTSMINARGTDLRGGRYSDLIGLVGEQRSEVRDLQRNVRDLQRNVDSLADTVQGTKINEVRRQVTAAEAAASIVPMRGPGLVVTLDDSPSAATGIDNVDTKTLVVHQQDIQAVVNALWSGGATGISIENQRIISTTGIKCVGNTVILQQIPYAPPYRIRAVGDPDALNAALQASKAVQAYVWFTRSPYELGYDVQQDSLIRLPAYSGPFGLKFARVPD